MNSTIDFLIVGAGLYGATLARILTDNNYSCMIIDKRDHVAGNIYTEKFGVFDKHVYGPHIFHTSDKGVIEFVTNYSEWIPYQLNTIATDGIKLYHLPFNMNTFYDIFGVKTPDEANELIEEEKRQYGVENPTNLEEQAINMVGKTIYEKLIKYYTEKQWNKPCTELSPDIIKRLPLRFTFDNNYFNDTFQAIPKDGYTAFIENVIKDIPFLGGMEFNKDSYEYWENHVKYGIIYCGAIDELLDYQLGNLEWRSLRFVDKEYKYNGLNGQGNAIINDVSNINTYTRSTEHMYFLRERVQPGVNSIITYEYPDDWEHGKERYYPVNNDNNNAKYDEYVELLSKIMPKVRLGGRLGKYKYFDMDDTIIEALNDANEIFRNVHTNHKN